MDRDNIRRGKGEVLRRIELVDDRFVVRAAEGTLKSDSYLTLVGVFQFPQKFFIKSPSVRAAIFA